MAKITKHQGVVVMRDTDGRITAKALSKDGKVSVETFRTLLNRATNGGMEMYENLLNIARGHAHVFQLPDGRESEPVIPTLEMVRNANKDLIEFLHGKAVAQTEVMAAEKEARNVEQLRAMSDEELWALAEEKSRALPSPEKDFSDESTDPLLPAAIGHGGEGGSAD